MGSEERRKREVEARKKSILDAGRTLFGEKGFASVTVDEIAERAELSKGTVYYYFASKHEILGTLQLENMELLHEWFEEAVAGVQDPIERLRSLAETYARYIREKLNSSHTMFLLHQDFRMAEMSGEIQGRMLAEISALFGYIQQAVKEGIDLGRIRSDLDPVKISFAFWGAAVGIHALGVKIGSLLMPDFAEAVSNEFLKLIPAGLAAGPTGEK